MPERRTPFHDFHGRSASSPIKGRGSFVFPTSYASSLEEHLNVRRNVGMQDLSTMGEVDIKGPGAERLVRRPLVNEVQDMEPVQATVVQTPFFDPEIARVRTRPHEDDQLSELVPEPARLTNARVPTRQSPNGNVR